MNLSHDNLNSNLTNKASNMKINVTSALVSLCVTLASMNVGHANGQYNQAKPGPIYQVGRAPLWSPVPGTVYTAPYGTSLATTTYSVQQYPYTPITRPDRSISLRPAPSTYVPVYEPITPRYRTNGHGGYSVQGRSRIVRQAPGFSTPRVTVPVLGGLALGSMIYQNYRNPQQFWSGVNQSIGTSRITEYYYSN